MRDGGHHTGTTMISYSQRRIELSLGNDGDGAALVDNALCHFAP
jgi:hypothetical protein